MYSARMEQDWRWKAEAQIIVNVVAAMCGLNYS